VKKGHQKEKRKGDITDIDGIALIPLKREKGTSLILRLRPGSLAYEKKKGDITNITASPWFSSIRHA
jgi:hypothetical protein